MSLAWLVAYWLQATPAPTAPAAPAPQVHVLDEKERVALQQTDAVRLSLPTESDVAAWNKPGLRVALGAGYGIVEGLGPALSWRSNTAMLRPSLRLDERWSLGLAALYGTAPNGVRWSVTAEPTFHAWRQLAVTAGLGFGGLSVDDPNAPTGRLRGPDEVVSRNLDDDERLQSCTGSALSSLVRAEYLFIVGPLFASGPFAQV